MGGSYGGYATLVGTRVHARGVRLRRGHRRPVEPHHAAEDASRRTGRPILATSHKRMGDRTEESSSNDALAALQGATRSKRRC